MKYNYSKTQIESIIKDCDSYSDVLTALNIPTRGNNIKTLRNKIEEYNIDISHFTYGVKKRSGTINTIYKPASEYLFKGSIINSTLLKDKLFKEGIKQQICECCGQTNTWNGKPLILQLDHINGDHTDNRLENLRILCPNCHSQTETFSSRRDKKHYYCEECGAEITKNAKLCPTCSAKHKRKVERPSAEEICNKFIEVGSLSQTGNAFGVCDNTIRKWLNTYNLPTKSKELRQYIIDNKNNLENIQSEIT